MSRDLDPLFAIKEQPLCFFPPLYYDVKVLKHRTARNGSEHQYFVHYLGWKNCWNDWVPEQQLIKRNEENLQRQADAKKAYEEQKETLKSFVVEPKAKTKRGHPRKTKTKNAAKPVGKQKIEPLEFIEIMEISD